MPEPIRLLHITDTHLHAHHEARMRGVNTFDSFIAVIEHVHTDGRPYDAVIATGDLVQDETRQGYERFRDVMIHLGVNVYCVPGNHDSQRIMEEVLNGGPFHYCGDFVLGDWCIVMLNSVIRLDDSGRMTPDELARLDQTLKKNTGKHAMLCMHHHPLDMGSQWLDGVALQNKEKLFRVIGEHNNVRSMVWGHVHQSSDRDHNGIRMLSSPSTSSQFLPHSDVFKMDTRPPGYRWIELNEDGSIDTEVVWLE
ncbi:MAG: 3',5'-cyclic-AMP phosphodiesterase [Gammaproteobacteria bacterium]